MDLLSIYKRHCSDEGLIEDPFQIQMVAEIQAFFRSTQRSERPSDSNRGLYLWGAVGRGKTMLMDLFFNSLDGLPKRRVHFHQLMRQVRERLAEIAGQTNPLSTIAAELAPAGGIICIDEFHVSDVDNALVVELLLKELVLSRSVVVTTSNFSPDSVIDDELGEEFRRNNPDAPVEDSGLFRTSKRETLRLLERSFHVVEIGGETDYRAPDSSEFRWFLDADAPGTGMALQNRFAQIANPPELSVETSVFGRSVECVKRTRDVYWFDYQQICENYYSYRDYLELLMDCRAVILENVDIRTLDGAKRFGWLVEVIYDAGLSLNLSASGGRAGLFAGLAIPDHLELEFQRIYSRVAQLTR